jgi:hypothetical protein
MLILCQKLSSHPVEKQKQKPKEQIHVLILNPNEQGFFPFKIKLIVSFHDEYLKSILLTIYTKSMLACLLKNLNNVKLYILLDASTLNLKRCRGVKKNRGTRTRTGKPRNWKPGN